MTGRLILDGDLVGRSGAAWLDALRRSLQMVFQDSSSSLNPRLPDRSSRSPTAPKSRAREAKAAQDASRSLMEQVGLNPNLFGQRYPHELSGGQKQRVNIARALALDPRLLILDEAVSALDKSVEAQVLNLLAELKAQLNLTYIFISHDLHVVRYISDRVLVMYLGQVVEIGPVEQIYERLSIPIRRRCSPASSAWIPDDRVEAAPLAGDPPNPVSPPSRMPVPHPLPFRRRRLHSRARRRSATSLTPGRAITWPPATWSTRGPATAARPAAAPVH